MTETQSLARRRFLVVDDELFSFEIVRRMLVGLGAEVSGAVDGEAAIVKLHAPDAAFDCVITDFNMPKLNGLELLKAIRTGAAGARREIPVVMLTGHADTDLVGTALALDANGFIVKPVSQKILKERLTRVLDEPPQIRSHIAYKVIQALTLADIMKTAAPEGGEESQEEAGADRTDRPEPRPASRTPRAAESKRPSPAPRKPDVSAPPSRRNETVAYRGPEIVRTLENAPDNSVLSRDIRTRSGVQLLAAGQTLTPRLLQRLRDLRKMGEPQLEIWLRSSG